MKVKLNTVRDIIKVLRYKGLYYENTKHYFLLGTDAYKFLKGDKVLNLNTLEYFRGIGLSYKSQHFGGLVFEKN